MWPGLVQASSLATQLVSLEANCRVIRRLLFRANSRVKTADWRPPLLELQD